MIVKLAIGGSCVQRIVAEQIDIADLRGMFCVHPRRAEAQQPVTVMMNWTVTHIPSGRVVAHGYSRQGAINEATHRIHKIGRRAFQNLALVHTLSLKQRLHKRERRQVRQADLFPHPGNRAQ